MNFIGRANRCSPRKGENSEAFKIRCSAQWHHLHDDCRWLWMERDSHVFNGRTGACRYIGAIPGTCFVAPGFLPLMHPLANIIWNDTGWRLGHKSAKQFIRKAFHTPEITKAMMTVMDLCGDGSSNSPSRWIGILETL